MFSAQSSAPYVCARCLLRHQRRGRSRSRPYSTETSVPPPPPSSGAAKLTNRRLISLQGPDTPKFLQGIITNNVRPESTSGFYTAFLTAQGKVLHDSFIYPTLGSKWHKETATGGEQEPGYLVEVDAEQADILLKHLKRHKLRSKFKLRLLEEGELDIWSTWREGDRWTAHGAQSSNNLHGDGAIALTDGRAPGMGQRILLPGAEKEAVLSEMEEAPLSAYTIRRYLRGVPEGQKELPRDDCLPMNSNIDLMGGIDFKKGCYLGQELTIRTHHTGVVRRRILPIVFYNQGGEPPVELEYDSSFTTNVSSLEGTEIRKDDKRQRSTGKFIAGVGNIGLGMCRLEQMSDLIISGAHNSYKAEDTFLVRGEDELTVGLRAFVPDWVRGNIREPKIQRRVD